MSTETMNSSASRARSSPRASGVETTGLPATVIRARTRPSPGVRISSARAATGNSLKCSARPRTRVWRRPNRAPRPRPAAPEVLAPPAAGVVNIAPPGRSRLPVSTLMTSTSQEASVPNSWVHVPMRP